MIATLAMSVLLLSQSGLGVAADEHVATPSQDVAYEELSDGKAAQAVRQLEAMREANPEDPAVLINLAAAYTGIGEDERAAECYRAAIASDTRYRLELADGSWVDSRDAARRGLQALETSRLAMK